MRLNPQRGGTIIGFIIGLLVGMAIAFTVAVYVSKVPVPFINKMGPRSADQDGSEAARNKNWDPNAPLYGKNPVKPITQAPPKTPDNAPIDAPAVTGDVQGEAKEELPAPASKPASADPLGDLARQRAQTTEPGANSAAAPPPPSAAATAPAGAEAGNGYFIQAGTYRGKEEADAQRAQLAMLGWEARVSEGQQSGRPVYRVRIGPFARRDDAEQLQTKLDSAGVSAILVRVAPR